MADARGTAYKERLAALVGLYGEAVTLIRSGENKPQVAFITPMADQYVNTFYDANEAVGLIRPTLTLYLVNGEVPVAGDVFFRDGRLFTVRKAHLYRVRDVVVLILALAD